MQGFLSTKEREGASKCGISLQPRKEREPVNAGFSFQPRRDREPLNGGFPFSQEEEWTE
jgi:hypothetical protein